MSDIFSTKPEVFERHISNRTKLATSSGKVAMNCDECGLAYETYACWAKRTAHHFCSRACASAWNERPVTLVCCVCGADFQTIPSQVKRHETCSRKCLVARRRRLYEDGVMQLSRGRVGGKLSAEQVRAIRADTRTQAVIAKEYGIDQVSVSNIKRGKTWAKLT